MDGPPPASAGRGAEPPKAWLDRFLWKSYFAGGGLIERFGRRWTRAGWLALCAAAASAALGLDTNQTTAYQAFAFAAALIGLSAACGSLQRVKVAAARRLPRFATVGAPLEYVVELRSESDAVQRGLSVSEDPPDPRPGFEQFSSVPEPGEEGRNAWDRRVRYHRWAWLTRWNRGALLEEAAAPDVPPRGRVEVKTALTPLRRGVLRLDGLAVARADPLGLFRKTARLSAPASVMVMPRLHPVPPLRLPGARTCQPGGVASARSVGESQEFVSLRDYRPGDPLRRIHWRSSAKAGRLVVKECLDEYFVRYGLILDTFTDDPWSEALEDAVSAASSLAVAMRTQESLIDLMFVGPQAYCFTAGRGVGRLDRLLEVLACAGPAPEARFGELGRLVAGRRAFLSACVVVLLGWDERRRSLVSSLSAMGVPVLTLVVGKAAGGPAGADGSPAPAVRLEPGRLAEGLAGLGGFS